MDPALADALERHPDDPRLHLRAARALIPSGERAAAAAHLSQAAHGGLETAADWRRLAEAHLDAGELRPAAGALTRALALEPGDPGLRRRAAEVWRRRVAGLSPGQVAAAAGVPPLVLERPPGPADVVIFGLTCAPWDVPGGALADFTARWLADAVTPPRAGASVHVRGKGGEPFARPAEATPEELAAVKAATGAQVVVTGRLVLLDADAPGNGDAEVTGAADAPGNGDAEVTGAADAPAGAVRPAAGRVVLTLDGLPVPRRGEPPPPRFEAALEEGRLAAGLAEALKGALDVLVPGDEAGEARADLAVLAELSDAALLDLAVLAEGRARRAADFAERLVAGAGGLALTRALVASVALELARAGTAGPSGSEGHAAGPSARAARLAEALLQARPEDAAVRVLLADLRDLAGDPAGAAGHLAAAYALDPHGVSGLRVAEAFTAAGEAGQAAAWYLRTAKEAPPPVATDALVALGLLHVKAGRTAEGRRRIEEALRRDRAHGPARAALARLAIAAGDAQTAVRHLVAGAVRLPAAERDALVDALSDLLLAQGDTPALLQVAEAATADDLTTPVLAAAFAVAALRHAPGRMERAAALLEPHLRAELPAGVAGPLRSLYADVLCRQAQGLRRDREEALRLYRRAREADPDHGPARVGTGEVLLAQGRAREAYEVLREAPGLPGAGPQAWAALGRACLALDRPDHARVAAERAGPAVARDAVLARAFPDLARRYAPPPKAR